MSTPCMICFLPVAAAERSYHPKCLKELFDTTRLPTLDMAIDRLSEGARTMIGGTSLSGVQQKLSLKLSDDKKRLEVARIGGTYVLKPQIPRHRHVPENEAITMRLARMAGIETPPCGLIRLTDGSLAYICRRFDREADGRKLPMEDFCQLAELPPKDKYTGSFEQAAKIVKTYASAPIVQLSRFYRLVLFSWWVGNEDLHRKNLSLLTRDREVLLAPAYDVLCSRLHFPDRELGLQLAGKDKRIVLRDWVQFAEVCRLKPAAALKIRESVRSLEASALDFLDRGLLPEAQSEAYKAIVRTNSALLREG